MEEKIVKGKENGQPKNGQKKRGGDGRESKMRRKREEEKDRERRDSQSMKQFDNLVILLLKSIPPQRSAIKRDTR